MTITDIIALAKQGYKPGDIKELIALTTPNVSESEDADPETKDTADSDTADLKADAAQDTGDTDSDNDTESGPDYKKLYEDTLKQLKTAQAENRHGDNKTPEKTPEEIAVEHFRRLI